MGTKNATYSHLTVVTKFPKTRLHLPGSRANCARGRSVAWGSERRCCTSIISLHRGTGGRLESIHLVTQENQRTSEGK